MTHLAISNYDNATVRQHSRELGEPGLPTGRAGGAMKAECAGWGFRVCVFVHLLRGELLRAWIGRGGVHPLGWG